MEYEPIFVLFQGYEPLFRSQDLDPDPHQGEKSDPDQHQIKIRIPICIRIHIRVISRIRIRILSDPHQGDADPQHWWPNTLSLRLIYISVIFGINVNIFRHI